MFGIGMGEFLLILIVGLIIFGPKNLPELGKTLGKGLREFRKAQAALTATLEESVNEPVKKSLDKDKPPTVDKNSETAQATTNEVGTDSIPKELYTGTAEVLTPKKSEPTRMTVDDLINTVKENPLSDKTAEEKISITKEKSA